MANEWQQEEDALWKRYAGEENSPNPTSIAVALCWQITAMQDFLRRLKKTIDPGSGGDYLRRSLHTLEVVGTGSILSFIDLSLDGRDDPLTLERWSQQSRAWLEDCSRRLPRYAAVCDKQSRDILELKRMFRLKPKKAASP